MRIRRELITKLEDGLKTIASSTEDAKITLEELADSLSLNKDQALDVARLGLWTYFELERQEEEDRIANRTMVFFYGEEHYKAEKGDTRSYIDWLSDAGLAHLYTGSVVGYFDDTELRLTNAYNECVLPGALNTAIIQCRDLGLDESLIAYNKSEKLGSLRELWNL